MDADIDHLTQDARAGYASVTEKLLATHKTADMGDMVTQAMTQAAQTLGDNSIQIATMQQQAIIGTDTLEQCQTILEQSAAKVHEIEAQGAAQRQIDEGKRAGLERRLMGGA